MADAGEKDELVLDPESGEDAVQFHGDEPTGVVVARAIRAGLEGAGVAVVPLTDMAL